MFGSPVEDYFKAEKDYYTTKQVREILIKFADTMIDQEEMFQEHVEGSNMYLTTDESLAQGIDKFMEGGEEE